jgi:hypothetical protein
MKVSELIELLKNTPPDADVKLAVNPSWPFECEISHIKEKHTTVYIVDSNKSSFIDIEKDMDIFKS